DVDTLAKARKAMMLGVYACAFVIALTLVALLLAPEMLGGSEMVVFVIGALVVYAIVGFFIWRNSRVAAIIGLALFALDKIVQFSSGAINGSAFSIFVALAILTMFINSIRGTFAQHRLKQAEVAIN